MNYNVIDCGVERGNTGLPNCFEDFGGWKKIVIGPADTEIDTKANAMLEATWIALANSAKVTRVFPMPMNFIVEEAGEELIIETGTFGDKRMVREGKEGIKIMLDRIALYLHKKLRTHNGANSLGFAIVTENGYIIGRSEDDVKFQFIPLSWFHVDKMTKPLGDSFSKTPINLEWDAKYINDQGVAIKPTAFDPMLLDGVLDVSITGALGATGATITVKGAVDGIGIVGLVGANFNLYADAAPTVAKTVTLGTDNLDGTYDLTWASITGAHTLTLFGQPVGTLGYEAIDSISTTV